MLMTAAYIAHAYTQAGAHMLIHDVCSTNRNRASNASEARLHTQSQGSYASTEGYDRSRGDNTANGQHTLVCGHVYVWRKTGPTVESCVRLRDTHLQRARRALVVIDTDGGGLGLRLDVLEHSSDLNDGAASFRVSLWTRVFAWRRHLRAGEEERRIEGCSQ